MDTTLSAGIEMVLAWMHFIAGITWIGLLYYFNLVQVPFMAEAPAEAKPGVTMKLVPRALWWFRWGAMFTVLSGLAIFAYMGIQYGGDFFKASRGVGLLLGGSLGIIMFLNVWLIIWPKQKIVIASAAAVAGGGQADPNAAAAAAKAFLASRTNFLFSIPMLFFMGNHRVTYFGADPKMSPHMVMGICLLIAIVLEVLFAVVGKKGQGIAKILDKHVAVLHVGLLLAVVYYFLLDGLL